MTKVFIERNLNSTLSFLSKINLTKNATVSFDQKDVIAIAHQNNFDFNAAYLSLLCAESKLFQNKLVFCSCCDSRKNFIRNHSLLSKDKYVHDVIKSPNTKMDPFLLYLEAKASLDVQYSVTLLQQVITEMPLFWDAYLLLSERATTFIQLDTQIAPWFYRDLKIYKDIDPPSISGLITDENFNLSSLPYNTEVLDINSKAALYYCYSNHNKALALFKSVLENEAIDIAYFEFFGMLLFNTVDSGLKLISESLVSRFKKQPETYTVAGLYMLSLGNTTEAIELFKKAIKQKNTPDLHCLLAYAYIKMNEYNKALEVYHQVLKISPNNFRIIYSVAQGYFNMNKVEISLWYCKKALCLRADGSIYKLMGRIHVMLNNLNTAVEYFNLALDRGEVDALLYMADAYRKKNEIETALCMYEKYIEKGRRNSRVVVKYLMDYYEEKGNGEKSSRYRSLYNELINENNRKD